jgi:hypothetical protein
MGIRTTELDRRRSVRGEYPGEPRRPDLIARILQHYREMPGLSLHSEQAARLMGLRKQTCEIVLQDLVRDGKLRRAADGQYVL